MLFSHGDVESVMSLMKTLRNFSSTSGLQLSEEKTRVLFGNVPEITRLEILEKSGFQEGKFPVKYLGVPLNSKKLTSSECEAIVDKMICKIKVWSKRKLSYMARLVLVNSTLASIYNYWSSVFVLPAIIIKKVKSVCIAYLWSGNCVLNDIPQVAWDNICKNKKEGGLGLKDIKLWNQVLIGKLCWDIAHKEDSLWVKWVHHVYLKKKNWRNYDPPSHTPWSWKRICKVNKLLLQYDHLSLPDYKTSVAYRWLKGEGQRLQWTSWIWSSYNTPKSRFIAWLTCLSKLKTRQRLKTFELCSEEICPACHMEAETERHIFFNCQYSKLCLTQLASILHISPAANVEQLFGRLYKKRDMPKRKKKEIGVYLTNFIYELWLHRNNIVYTETMRRPEYIVQRVLQTSKDRIESITKVRKLGI